MQAPREGDERVWRQVDEWFTTLDKNRDDYLDIEEIRPYVVWYLKKEFDMEADKDLVESTFIDLTFDGKHVTKQALYDHIMTVAGFTKEEAIDEQLRRKQQERAKLDLEIAKK